MTDAPAALSPAERFNSLAPSNLFSLKGKRVLVTGCGPIGALTIMAARAHGAAEIVATDLADAVLAIARRAGADRTINVSGNQAALDALSTGKGSFDIQFEASGSGRAVRSGLDVLRPRGVLVQIGTGGDIPLPLSIVVAKEIELRGSFRFHEEFALAVSLHEKGVFTWPEWAEALGREIAAAPADDGSHYYEHWLSALEKLVGSKGLT